MKRFAKPRFAELAILSTLIFAIAPTAWGAEATSSSAAGTTIKKSATPAAAGTSSAVWAKLGLPLDSLKGKSIVAMTYVTWCPICNGWAPQMLKELKTVSADKPVVIVAIATDVGQAEGKDFLAQKGFGGPNIIYAANSDANEILGVNAKNLWNYVRFGPDGDVKDQGAAGAFYGDKKDSVIAKHLSDAKDLGTLDFVNSSLTPEALNVAWSMELGDVPTMVKVAQSKGLPGLSKDDTQALHEVMAKFLDGRLTELKALVGGDMPNRIEAYEKATQFSTVFRATPQGKEASKTADQLYSDPKFRREVSAKKLYVLGETKAAGDDKRLAKSMHVVAQKFPDTYYGGLAQQKIGGAEKKE
jgi:hypothetical protein